MGVFIWIYQKYQNGIFKTWNYIFVISLSDDDAANNWTPLKRKYTFRFQIALY